MFNMSRADCILSVVIPVSSCSPESNGWGPLAIRHPSSPNQFGCIHNIAETFSFRVTESARLWVSIVMA
jgi:hypothetical protein